MSMFGESTWVLVFVIPRPGHRLHRLAGSWTVMKKPPGDCRAAK
jgi:hypothetical protein